MMYRLRAYASQKAGESGRVTPANTCTTGAWPGAVHTAKGWAAHYGACVIENTATSERHWF